MREVALGFGAGDLGLGAGRADRVQRAARVADGRLELVAARAQFVDALVGQANGSAGAPSSAVQRRVEGLTAVDQVLPQARLLGLNLAALVVPGRQPQLDLALGLFEARGFERDRRRALEQPGVDGHGVPDALGRGRGRPRAHRTAGAAPRPACSSTVCCSAIRLPDRRPGLGLARVEPGDFLLRPARVEQDEFLLLPHAGGRVVGLRHAQLVADNRHLLPVDFGRHRTRWRPARS